MSPPPDRRSASGGLLDAPKAQWAAPANDFWRDSDPSDPRVRFQPPAGSGGRTRGPAQGRRGFVYPKRRWPRRILVGVNIVVALMLIAAGSVYGYVKWRFGQIHTVSIPTLSGANVAPGAPMTILVVGSDTRTGLSASDTSQFGSASQVGGQRSDTIMLVHVDPSSAAATVMSIPRDLWVQIPGKTTHDRINTTFDTGPDLLVKAIQQDLGITVDHYVEVNFDSFRQVVNAVGGVKEYFPTAARDAYSLLNIPGPGCYTLNGDMALSFVRARHYEYKVNGRWVYEAESDLARIKRQQSFIKKMIAKAQSSGLTNPIELNNIVGGVTKNLTVDSGFSQSLMLSLGKRFRNLSPGSLPTATLPTTPTVINGADVLLLQQPAAQQAVSDFMNPPKPGATATTAPPASSSVAPSSVQVLVLNGSGRNGEAAKASSDLQRQGFVVTGSHSADNFSYTTTVIRYLPGNEAKAQLVASAVQGPTQLQADPTIQGADVALVTGQSYTGINAVAAAGTATTATTAPASTATTVYELPGTPAGFVAPPC
ncbi:MAG TPA: LCP family protein [Acidimicrobiales bacterium]|nr:LCP family protein [Acidimicrobiales bacterium]